jgi:uncharacterized damage-inducible protein DinB
VHDPRVIGLLKDLVLHKGHANAAMLAAVRGLPAAAADPDVLELLHHVLVSNRFWTCTIRGLDFVAERELGVARDLAVLRDGFRATQEEEAAWLASATEADGGRILVHPFIPGGQCSVAEAMTQVCLHSHGHRSQLAKLLRRHGGTPPAGDFILWLVERPAPDWGTPSG